jgi:hypothetical protein
MNPFVLEKVNQNSLSFEDAESLFQTLKNENRTALHLIITWEEIEHEEPGVYDEAYLAYLRKIIKAAEKENISVFIDPRPGEKEVDLQQRGRYTAAFNHAKRRLKNCASIAGWDAPVTTEK